VKETLDKRLFRGALQKIRNETIDCLDIGGGVGWISNHLRESDSRVRHTTIVDINEKSRAAAESNGHKFINSTIDSFVAKNEFDFALMLNLIEHVADPRKTLCSINSAIRPDGLLLIKTPNTSSLNRQIFQKLYWGGYHAPRHWVLFNKTNFISLAEECGFVIESFRYTQGAPQWVASILGTIRRYRPNRGNKPMYSHPLAPVLSLLFAAFDFLRLPLFPTDQMIVLLKKV